MTKEVRKRVCAIYVAIKCSDLSRGAGAALNDRGAAIQISSIKHFCR